LLEESDDEVEMTVDEPDDEEEEEDAAEDKSALGDVGSGIVKEKPSPVSFGLYDVSMIRS
jgi:hypothetical protein